MKTQVLRQGWTIHWRRIHSFLHEVPVCLCSLRCLRPITCVQARAMKHNGCCSGNTILNNSTKETLASTAGHVYTDTEEIWGAKTLTKTLQVHGLCKASQSNTLSLQAYVHLGTSLCSALCPMLTSKRMCVCLLISESKQQQFSKRWMFAGIQTQDLQAPAKCLGFARHTSRCPKTCACMLITVRKGLLRFGWPEIYAAFSCCTHAV